MALMAGSLAGSIALVGFGFDSMIEVTAGAFVLRRIHSELQGASPEQVQSQGRTATRVVGITFLVLGAYIVYEAASAFWTQESPEQIEKAVFHLEKRDIMDFRYDTGQQRIVPQ